MDEPKRVFILGAGFSKPAGMPLANELLPLLSAELELDEMREWLDGMRERLVWLAGQVPDTAPYKLNIEEVFHYAHFDIEAHRLRQHLAPVGRGDGPGTPWRRAGSIEAWLGYLEEALRDVIFECDQQSELDTISRWAQSVTDRDAVLTFNYDTLVERSLSGAGRVWNHGTGRDADRGIPVFKLHGSIDWIVAHRSESVGNFDLLFDKTNTNRAGGGPASTEDEYRLWRCQSAQQLRNWISGRDLQIVPTGASELRVGIGGLGAYKELHQVPGLGVIWARGMRALYNADVAIVVGFSMSDFDAMAQLQFAEVARKRAAEGRPLRVTVVNPSAGEEWAQRPFKRVFRTVKFVPKAHQDVDWLQLS